MAMAMAMGPRLGMQADPRRETAPRSPREGRGGRERRRETRLLVVLLPAIRV